MTPRVRVGQLRYAMGTRYCGVTMQRGVVGRVVGACRMRAPLRSLAATLDADAADLYWDEPRKYEAMTGYMSAIRRARSAALF
ncbi:hypothetical protein B7486_11395 [cyanobacterium TDX16]|nr:hypothetical protein B7486_11395 [cyanobacterium TDX16]